MIIVTSILYSIAFLVLWILLTTLLQVIMQFLIKSIFNYDFVKDKETGCIRILIIILYLVPSIFLTYEALGLFNYYPPFLEESKVELTSEDIKDLQTEYSIILSRIKMSKAEAENLSISTDSLRRIEESELEKINKIINKTSQIQNRQKYWENLITGFLVGVFSSMTATWLLSWRRKKQK